MDAQALGCLHTINLPNLRVFHCYERAPWPPNAFSIALDSLASVVKQTKNSLRTLAISSSKVTDEMVAVAWSTIVSCKYLERLLIPAWSLADLLNIPFTPSEETPVPFPALKSMSVHGHSNKIDLRCLAGYLIERRSLFRQLPPPVRIEFVFQRSRFPAAAQLWGEEWREPVIRALFDGLGVGTRISCLK
ncbi:hypothetical protein CC1G_14280 [Coprinopsis cinerea okayama7|uniref:F-box domain-containing protein n=1 Tax=Coprinopsis cinerea (strain Okayama-7 / 130 / ATCC MYA-4618 / FGSC 9003) TaxID=240176 RepID=D6RLG2_COPC7|nr:hypothetical protein CC1G_14280 [Coprinopsis cinerea okayama7\|eukprot:XP_002911750.1 hypothetical protein CC1G_14280 [Coprinopsis cinerea okayama7\